MTKEIPEQQQSKETFKRSVIKTVTYRFSIILLDFITLYWFTEKIKIAVAYTIVSNTYTIVAYLIHERMWDKIEWGKIIYKKVAMKA